MATDVDLRNTTMVNGSLQSTTIRLSNTSVTSFDGLFENTTEIFTTEAWSDDLGTKEEQWGWLATTVLLLATLMVNGAVLGVTWKASRLHSSLYALLASLSIAHTFNALLDMPMAIKAAIYGKFINISLLQGTVRHFIIVGYYLLFC